MGNRFGWIRGGAVAAGAAVALSLTAGGALAYGASVDGSRSVEPAKTITCHFVPFTPNSNFHGDHAMHGIAAISKSDIWAVGSFFADHARPLGYHYNGKNWKLVTSFPATQPGWADQVLLAVAADASNDVWAFGGQYKSSDDQLIVEHFNGTHWTVAKTFAFSGNGELDIRGAVAISPKDVWFGAEVVTATGYHPFTFHWDGSTWTTTQLPSHAVLLDLAGTAGFGVYALGSISANPVIFRWAGTHWVTAHSYAASNDSPGEPSAIAVSPAGRVVAVGQTQNEGQNFAIVGPTPRWAVQKMPVPDRNYPRSPWVFVSMTDVATGPGKTLWAVGAAGGEQYRLHYSTVYRYDGTKWQLLNTPMDAVTVTLEAVAVVPGTRQVYAVGYRYYSDSTADDAFMTRLC